MHASKEANKTDSKPNSTTTLSPIQPNDFDISRVIYTRSENYTHTAYLDGTLYKCFELDDESTLITIKVEGEALKAQLYGLRARSG